MQRRARNPQKHSYGERERQRPERHVEPERLPLEECVAENGEDEGRTDHSNAPPHGRLFKHARLDEKRL
jgi:hypothetical protein